MCRGCDLGQSEVQNLGLPTCSDEDIRRLDVAVDDALGMRSIQSVGDLDREIERGSQLKRASTDAVFQRHPFQILHGDEGFSIVLADFVGGADVGMIERRCHARFTLKALQGLGIFGEFFRKELEGDEAAEFQVFRLVDDAHPATTQLLHDAVVRDIAVRKGDVFRHSAC